MGRLLVAEKYRFDWQREKALQIIGEIFPETRYTIGIHVDQDHLVIGRVQLDRGLGAPGSLRRKNPLYLRSEQMTTLESLGQCVQFNWIPILVGPEASGKTSLVEMLAKLSGRPLDVITLNSMTDTSELIGSYEQSGPKEDLRNIMNTLETLAQRLTSNPLSMSRILHKISSIRDKLILPKFDSETILLEELKSIYETLVDLGCDISPDDEKVFDALLDQCRRRQMSFKWFDSALTRAVRDGTWILLVNANLCNAAVLDRLNGLCESGGFLTLDGAGDTSRKVKPHKDFRLFMTINPSGGELSDAMR